VGLSDEQYRQLLALRTDLRRFLRWSDKQARAAGLNPAQHQLLLAVRGHGGPGAPTIGDVAEHLLLEHHSAVGLVDRAEAAGLVERVRPGSGGDRRVVRLRLTPDGEGLLERLSASHLDELARLGLGLPRPVPGAAQLDAPAPPEPLPGAGRAHLVATARVYGPHQPTAAHGVLVDRLWPRGLARSSAPFDEWMSDVAPSTELRRWYDHRPERFERFAAVYRQELGREPASGALSRLHRTAAERDVVLFTATRDLALSAAEVLRQVLAGGRG
jgi:uncharacterized protein YeaO (DUF488 family)/DNA-binding MarR family transcriptional regulator